MYCRDLDQAKRVAQGNANLSGVPWVIFLSTSGSWYAERYRPTSPCHNEGAATRFDPTSSTSQPVRRPA